MASLLLPVIYLAFISLGLPDSLLATDNDCEVMHEGFDSSDPSQFTREWFAWANSLFALYVLDLKKGGEI